MMDGAGRFVFATQCQTHHATEFVGQCIADNADNAHGSQGNQRESDAIVTTDYVKVLRFVLNDVIHLGDVTAGFLYGHDVFKVASQTQCCLCCHVHPGTAGYIVKHNGKRTGLCQRAVMLIKSLLRRFVIIGAYAQYAIDALPVKVLQFVHNRSRAVATTTHQQGHSARHTFHKMVLEHLLFLGGQSRCFRCGSHNAQEIHTAFYLIFHQTV